MLGLLFFATRTGGEHAQPGDRRQRPDAPSSHALDHDAARRARDHASTGMPCSEYWPLLRNSHLGAMVIVRREGFSNDQWLIEGVNLLDLKYRAAGYFAADPSQLVRPNGCRDPLHRTIDASLPRLPRDDFDYVWLIDVPPYDPRLVAGMQPVWRGPGSILYQSASMTALSIVVPCFNEEACLRDASRAARRGRARRRSARIMRSCWSTTARATAAGRSCSSMAAERSARRRGQPVAQPRPPAGADRRARPVPRRHRS